MLVENFTTTIDDLADLLIRENQTDGIPPIIFKRLKAKLECRGKLLTLGFINENALLDKITMNYPTLDSFKLMTYKQLNDYCRETTQNDHRDILKNPQWAILARQADIWV
ncbi:unnamed protein product [Didymodactylos carnosus]|uniref:Uncharacterized protein n=1 Tax=Didymodactylos carnosus TaxID=1234261 RepID=A0A815YSG9_9BILA|nr:unnamed protein product [Didymodactylos carnosus]CAF1595351.1 unnamed protein product [Didymodactylos carnosus]CAF4401276.1 unnamed protein product [Didymodactylos carnosus]CAF4437713.1 unnamed protein product [Didymodactylos carnosus]